MPADSDEALLLKIRGGDRSALAVIFDRYRHLLFVVGRRILKDDEEAEDLAQEVFVYLLQKSHLFDPTKGSARSWIVQIAYCRAFTRFNYLKARHGNYDCSSDSEEQASKTNLIPFPGRNQGETLYWQSRIKATVHKLSKKQWQAVRLWYYFGYSFEEIARVLHCSHPNAKYNVYQGLKILRKELYGGNNKRAES